MRGKNIQEEYNSVSAPGANETVQTGAVVDHARAQGCTEETPDARIFAVEPSSMASGYRFARTSLTAIDLEALPARTSDTLSRATDRDRSTYTLLVLGRHSPPADHTPDEYA